MDSGDEYLKEPRRRAIGEPHARRHRPARPLAPLFSVSKGWGILEVSWRWLEVAYLVGIWVISAPRPGAKRASQRIGILRWDQKVVVGVFGPFAQSQRPPYRCGLAMPPCSRGRPLLLVFFLPTPSLQRTIVG